MKEKLLVLSCSLLIVLQVLGFIFEFQNIYKWSGIILIISIVGSYIRNNANIVLYQLLIVMILAISELLPYFENVYSIQIKLIFQICVYILLFKFLYKNHKSFRYNRRDVFTLLMGSVLYTIIFVVAFSELRMPLASLWIYGFINLLLLYILLIVTAMHYINIRSPKSLWFFLSILYFTFSDFIFLFDQFYLSSIELQVIRLFCKPIGFLFIVNYLSTKHQYLKADEFEGF